MLAKFDVLCALDCIADNVLELYRSPICDALFERSSGLGVNGIVAKLLLRCVVLGAEPEALAPPADADDPSYAKFDALALDALGVAADDAPMDDNTDGNECVPLICCVDDAENAAL